MGAQKFLVLFYCTGNNEKAVRVEVENVTAIIQSVNSPVHFCTANELVNRNKITSDPKKMLKEALFKTQKGLKVTKMST